MIGVRMVADWSPKTSALLNEKVPPLLIVIVLPAWLARYPVTANVPALTVVPPR